jgi:hypothetical protein
MDFLARESKDTLAFLNARTPIAVDRKTYDERVAALQRLMHGTPTQLPTPASPAAMQLALLENQGLLLNGGPLDDAAIKQVEDALNLASIKLSEGTSFTLRRRNELENAWPRFYLVFETRMLLSLAALKPRAPMTHRGCNSMWSFILSRPPLAALVKQLEAELSLTSDRLFGQPWTDAIARSIAERDYRDVSKRAIKAVTDIYADAVPPDLPPFNLPVVNPMIDPEHVDLPLLIDESAPPAGGGGDYADFTEANAFD